MPKSKAEQERAYYNKKLIQDGMKDELKKPFSWKKFLIEFSQYFIGILIGRRLITMIGTETLITNATVRFIAEVLILAAMIMIVHLVYAGIKELMQKSN